MEPERPDAKRRHSEVQLGAPMRPNRVPPPVMRNFDHVRDNIRTHSQSIFSIPHHKAPTSGRPGSASSDLPPRTEFVRLSRSYLDTVHEWYPILDLATFQHEVDAIYTRGSLTGMTREWVALFFAVLACGSLQSPASQHGAAPTKLQGSSYFVVASQSLMPWPQDISIRYTQAALLLSIFSDEHNWKSEGSMWLGSAVRAAQELNVHYESDTSSAADAETRRRIWWTLYVRDR